MLRQFVFNNRHTASFTASNSSLILTAAATAGNAIHRQPATSKMLNLVSLIRKTSEILYQIRRTFVKWTAAY
jgi:hypothetical protein